VLIVVVNKIIWMLVVMMDIKKMRKEFPYRKRELDKRIENRKAEESRKEVKEKEYTTSQLLFKGAENLKWNNINILNFDYKIKHVKLIKQPSQIIIYITCNYDNDDLKWAKSHENDLKQVYPKEEVDKIFLEDKFKFKGDINKTFPKIIGKLDELND
jgi:hypothetical protein